MDNLQELAREQLGGPMVYELIQVCIISYYHTLL